MATVLSAVAASTTAAAAEFRRAICVHSAVWIALILYVHLVTSVAAAGADRPSAVERRSPYNRIRYAGEHIHVGDFESHPQRRHQHQRQQTEADSDVGSTYTTVASPNSRGDFVLSTPPPSISAVAADCPVKPPCFCSTSAGVSVTHRSTGKSSSRQSPLSSSAPSVVVSQRITCGVFDANASKTSRRSSGSRRGSKHATSGGEGGNDVADVAATAASATRRFPRFVESNDAVERQVSLSYSGLTTIPGAAFHALKIVELDLQGNNFGDRISPKAFVGVGRRLVSLNLAWSNITRLSGKLFRGLTAVRNLSLAENKLRRLPHGLFDDLTSVERITLAGNSELNELPFDLFQNQGSSLQVLDLGYCALDRLPWKVFGGLAALRSLDVRGNGLRHIEPFTFADLHSLNTLLLGHNPLTRLHSKVFYGLTNLTVLRVDESSIEHIDNDVFRDARRIETLDLGDNRLSAIPPGTLLLPAMRQLALDGNGLNELPADIAYLPLLRHLDVSYNRIRSIDRCLLSNARRLDFVNLRENPFHCDCSLFWLRGLRATVMSRWTDRRASVPFVPGRCWTPTELRGVSVTNWLSLDCVQSAAAAASSSGTPRDPSWLPSGSAEWDRCNRV